MNNKGSLAIEYLVIIVLALIALIVLLLFSTTVGEKITEGIKHFFQDIIGRR